METRQDRELRVRLTFSGSSLEHLPPSKGEIPALSSLQAALKLSTCPFPPERPGNTVGTRDSDCCMGDLSAVYNGQPQAVLGTQLVFLDQCFVCLHGPNTKQSENVPKNSDLLSSSVEKVEYLTKLDPLCCIARLWVLRVPVPVPMWVLGSCRSPHHSQLPQTTHFTHFPYRSLAVTPDLIHSQRVRGPARRDSCLGTQGLLFLSLFPSSNVIWIPESSPPSGPKPGAQSLPPIPTGSDWGPLPRGKAVRVMTNSECPWHCCPAGTATQRGDPD